MIADDEELRPKPEYEFHYFLQTKMLTNPIKGIYTITEWLDGKIVREYESPEGPIVFVEPISF